MRKATVLLIAVALVTAGCGGGGSSCAAIVDDGVELFQDAINELDGLALDDIQDDPFATEDFDRRSEDLDKRTTEAGCTNEELSELFTERIGDLSAGVIQSGRPIPYLAADHRQPRTVSSTSAASANRQLRTPAHPPNLAPSFWNSS